MKAEPEYHFPPFRLDPANARLWRDGEAVAMRPKTFDVLCCLVERAGQLVTKAEILATVWPGARVSEAGLKRYIQEIRVALGDSAESPRFIETVPRRGYRFLPTVTTHPVRSSEFGVRSQNFKPVPSTQPPAPTLVGREAELARLHGWLAKALSGERQLVFITGEPGIGKTALVEAFLEQIEEARDGRLETSPSSSPPQFPTPNTQPPAPVPWIAHGQCIEHYGPGEAYLPILAAFGRLCREPGGEWLIEFLMQHAPTWLVQMPALLKPDALDALQRKTQGTTRERMLRELAEALEVLTAENPLVLCLEDLHWSDHSTLDLLSFIARRKEPARLLVLGTYRPVEMLSEGHPLKNVTQELYAHQLATEVSLGLLSEADIAAYLAARFRVPSPLRGAGQGEGNEQAFPQHLAHTLHHRTDGNPLFLVSLVNDLIERGLFVQTDTGWELNDTPTVIESEIPDSIRHLVARQSGRLSAEEQHTLEAASVAGMEFSAASVAAALAVDAAAIEHHCEHLAQRQQFLRRLGVEKWPDGTMAARYGFQHALYQQLWHERVSVTRLQRLHLQIGERKEKAYGDRAREIATELAMHFEQGREYRRAVQYLQQAAENTLQRSANQEAVSLLTKALEFLKTLPDTPERTRQELTLQITLGAPLMATKGYGAPEVEKVYARAREPCQQVGGTPQLFPVVFGLWLFYRRRGEVQTARELGEQLLALAQSVQDPALLLQAHHAQWTTLFHLGEFAPAREHCEQGLTLYDPQQHRSHAFLYGGHDPGVCSRMYGALVLWLLGYPDRALRRSQEALTLAQELSHPFSLVAARWFVARLHQFRWERQAAQERAETALTLSSEHGFAQGLAEGTILRGWALAEQGQREEGIAQMHQGLATLRATGAEGERPYYLGVLAEVHGKGEQIEEGLTILAEALDIVDKTGERFSEAELYRLKGELTLKQFGVRSQGKSKQVKASQNKFGVRSPELESPSPQPLTPNTRAEVGREAEECFHKAIDIARKQQAKSWELRATTSLARLWQQQGKRQQAHRMLAESYNWFTEGFDTADLKEAKALLEELL